MPSIATCTFVLRPLTDFGGFETHVRSVLDAAVGADLVVLPELLTTELFTLEPGWEQAAAEDFRLIARHTDRYLELFAREARERRQVILAGSQLVETEDGVRNVAHLFGPQGLLHAHAKTHLFPSEAVYGTGEGDDLAVVELPFGVVGINICYEVEIPECTAAAVEQGATIVLNPSMTLTEAGSWRVRHCAQARAVENQIYVAVAQMSGAPAGPISGCWGWSGIVSPCDAPWESPRGVLADLAPNTEGAAVADVSLDDLARVRDHGAVTTYRDRRRRADRYRAWPSHVHPEALDAR
jgi:predicted amidohydrolase